MAAELRARMAERTLREGDRLPPLSELGREFGVSRPTLREALRVLEGERLLELRAGDRAGAAIRAPSTHTAAQLAGIVLEARGTTLADFSRAVRAVEPGLMAAAAAQFGADEIERLRHAQAELAASVDDTARFVRTWRDTKTMVFGWLDNPALAVVGDVLQWVRVGLEPTITADAGSAPLVTAANRRAAARFAEFLTAVGAGEPDRAGRIWGSILDVGASFFEDSQLGNRLVVDLMG